MFVSDFNDKDFAILTNRLHVPLVVQDILHGDEVLDDTAHFSLHEIISDYQPDAALLCIAVSLQKIARIYQGASPIMRMVSMRCDSLIADYADPWLKHARTKDFAGDMPANDVDEEETFDILKNIPEDLEGLAELLELAADFLSSKDNKAAQICEIFEIQAKSHSIIAEEYLHLYESQRVTKPASASHIIKTASNIITFPGRA